MTALRLRVRDFMDGRPLRGAVVKASLTVFPMQITVIQPRPEGPRKPTRITTPDLTRRVDLPEQQATSDAQGAITLDVDTRAAFQQLRTEATSPDETVRARLNLDVTHAGFQRSLVHVHGDIDENDVVRRDILVDHARSIVGHTTTDAVTLWFGLHAAPPRGAEYHCEVAGDDGAADRRVRVRPGPANAHTATVTVTGLQPDTGYTYRLLHRPGPPVVSSPIAAAGAAGDEARADRFGAETEIVTGTFRTARTDRDRLDLAFTSCHLPAAATSLNRWQHLGNRDEPDLLLLMGDQIYEDGVERLGDDWFERYVAQYHRFWSPHAVRDVLRRVPTYMIFDDHEVRDDWGTVPFDESEQGREAGALRAYRLFQKAHGPGGASRPTEHYSFTRGPAAFFVLDGRTNRVAPPPEALQREHGWDDPPTSTVLGARQIADLRAWARAPETRASDVIVLVAPVPLAFLPVQEILRLVEELEDDARDTGAGLGSIIGGAIGAGIGFLVGGPPGAVVGGLLGGAIGGAGGAYLGHSMASGKIEDRGLEVLSDKDIADVWTWEPHQNDLVAVLDVLFDLANDIQADGRPGPRPRAVFVLGGDVHTGAMHVISSDTRKNPRHRRNPLVWQVIASPISKQPAPDGVFAQAVKHIVPGLGVSKWKLVRHLGDVEKIAEETFGKDAAHFPLDDRRGSRYHTEIVDVARGRNYGRLQIERVRGRVYRFFVTIEAEDRSVARAFELDLDADPVRPAEVFGKTLSVEGRLTLLRIHDVGQGFGPPTDRIDGEVVVAVDRAPGQAFGFTLRTDGDEAAHRGMLDVLRSAFADAAPVRLIYVRTGLTNGRLIRAHRVG
jgi:hypothetical protein